MLGSRDALLNLHLCWAKTRIGMAAVLPRLQTVVSESNLRDGADVLRRRPYGVIEAAGGRFLRVVLRRFPKMISAPDVVLRGGAYHRCWPGDRLWLYYNQPRWFSNFLVLKYVVSTRRTSMGTLTRALAVLDEIARLKRSDALMCDVGNWRISTKLLGRWGWQPHCPSRWHRHYIKRFYGQYPARPGWLEPTCEAKQAEILLV